MAKLIGGAATTMAWLGKSREHEQARFQKSMVSCFLHASMTVLLAATGSSWAQNLTHPDGCYLSRTYEGGVQDAMLLKRDGKGGMLGIFETAYCDLSSTDICPGVKIEQYSFQLRPSNAAGQLVGNLGTCRIAIRQFQSNRLFVSQESHCSELKYWGVHGVFTKVDVRNQMPTLCQSDQ